MKTRAPALVGSDIDLAAMIGNYPFTKSQADTGALEMLPGVKPLEDQEDPFLKPGIDADTLVDEDDLDIGKSAIQLRMFL